MSAWGVDFLGLGLLCLGMRMGEPRFLRALCTFGLIYLVIFFVTYYFWLKWKFQHFKTHPEMIHIGIASAFGFEGFWKVLANMLLLQGLMPVAVAFVLYFAVKWLASPPRPGSNYY
jgi:hypothetical protein